MPKQLVDATEEIRRLRELFRGRTYQVIADAVAVDRSQVSKWFAALDRDETIQVYASTFERIEDAIKRQEKRGSPEYLEGLRLALKKIQALQGEIEDLIDEDGE